MARKMSEMVNRVAKAINQSEGPSRESPEDRFERLARAAITAMLDLTPDEIEAGASALSEHVTYRFPVNRKDCVREIFLAISDKALRDG